MSWSAAWRRPKPVPLPAGGPDMETGHAGEVTPFPITGSASASEIAQRLAATAFQARNLGRAAAIWEAMLRDEATVFLGLAGAMVPAGMRPLIVYLIENRPIDRPVR